jgi:hypothetical protein
MQLASFLFVVLLCVIGIFLLGRAFLTMGKGVHSSFPISRGSLAALAVIFALLIVSVGLMIWGLA